MSHKKPIEIFDKLVGMILTHTPSKSPGAMLKYLTEEEREELKKISSTDVSKRRVDWI